ncbi:probable G-protein coupled receptor frpr-1 [Pomacea canaliculata]|uniref:probable G-protein coupled receptor frpr-1 n=1 Tax=Pomacea canaliculata TaxID=400727 RepID=UPI000D7313D0|nr:probable G-protein coupled receptor frpr-1 [Pomacea canaliculata]
MLETSWYHGNNSVGPGDGTSVTLPSSGGSLSYVPEGCIVVRSDSYKPWENPYDLVSHKAEILVRIILNATATPLLFLFGFPANILNAVVFYRQGIGERINMCLFVLSLTDLVGLTAQFLRNLEQMYRALIKVRGVLEENIVGFTGFSKVSQFITCVIACERFLCVFLPFKAQKYLKTSSMAAVIGVIGVFLLGGMWLIAGHKHTFTCVFDPLTNETDLASSYTSFYLDHKYVFDIIDVFVYTVVFSIVLQFLIIITSILTVIKLYQAFMWRHLHGAVGSSHKAQQSKDLSRLSKKEVATTKMLLASSLLFIVCFSPIVMLQLSLYLVKDLSNSGRYYNLLSVLWKIVAVLRMVTASLNFVIYYHMGSRFRTTLKDIVSCVRK